MTGQQAYSRLTALCARSEHCQQEMLEKMRQWGVTDEEQAQVMARLVKEKYVDDSRYARAFVNDKVHYDGGGAARWNRHCARSTSTRRFAAKCSTPCRRRTTWRP